MSRIKPLPTDPVARLAAVGEAMYGSAWQIPLAKALDVGRNTVGRWISKIHPTPPDLDKRLAEVVRRRSAEKIAQSRELDVIAAYLDKLTEK